MFQALLGLKTLSGTLFAPPLKKPGYGTRYGITVLDPIFMPEPTPPDRPAQHPEPFRPSSANPHGNVAVHVVKACSERSRKIVLKKEKARHFSERNSKAEDL